MKLNRRQTTQMLLALGGVSALPLPLQAESAEGKRVHGTSLVGDVKYAADYERFSYVNPDAPKGGKIRLSAQGGFDSFNPFIVKGSAADRVGIIYDALMQSPLDEDSAEYGLLAEWMESPADSSWVMFKLRDEARWHDGEPITPEDVVFSFELLTTQAAPFFSYYYANVAKAEALDGNIVRFEFDQKDNRELPHIMGQLAVLPKHYWKDRDFSESSLEKPLGSGPYKIGAFEANRYCEFERVDDYWGKDLPINIGSNNFQTLRYEYFKDDGAAFEAFKSGEIDYREENSSLNWGTKYDFPAFKRGEVVREAVELAGPKAAQSFAFNTRREMFKDRRVREALSMAFDFEWLNKAIFFGSYARPSSYFQGTPDLMSGGKPEGLELEILEEFRADLPAEVFDQEFTLPVTDGTGRPDRRTLRKAKNLLAEAGWTVKSGKLVDGDGKPFEFEFLIGSGAQERVVAPFVKNLERLGIDASIRLVDSAQYTQRYRAYDFDMVIGRVSNSSSPGNEQREFWRSSVAEKAGGRNINGVQDPVVDELIEKIIFAKDREELAAASRALDRVLLWGHYNILQLYTPTDRIAWWKDRIGHPDPFPSHNVGFPNIWWATEKKT